MLSAVGPCAWWPRTFLVLGMKDVMPPGHFHFQRVTTQWPEAAAQFCLSPICRPLFPRPPAPATPLPPPRPLPLISPPPFPCHAPTLPSPPPQALWLTCSEDILLGRADNGKMGLPEVARGRLGGGRGGWGRLAGWPIYAWLAGDLGWVAGCLPSNTHNI